MTRASVRVLMAAGIGLLVAAGGVTDRDGDGVADDVDVCCHTPTGLVVDGEGRPVEDRDDDCDVDLDDFAVLFADLTNFPASGAGMRAFAAFQTGFSGDLPPDGPCCALPLEPLDDGTGLPPGGVPPIMISEIRPQEHIEVFNTTESDINLASVSYQWCAPFDYSPVQAHVIVPANGYATLPWPAFLFNPAESDGELILFRDSFFENASSILDFVCWGATSPFFTRKSQAETAGKWSAACAPSIPSGGAIHRRPGTTGTGEDSYDVTAPPSPMNCAP